MVGRGSINIPTSYTQIGLNLFLLVGPLSLNPFIRDSKIISCLGATAETAITFKKNNDDQGEVIYEIQQPNGEDEPMKFQIKPYRGKLWNKGVYSSAQILGPLRERIIPSTDNLELGFNEEAAVPFVLAGDLDRNFTSTNTPVDFLAANLYKWGDRSLRQLALPATHNSGMGTITHKHNLAGSAGAQTQSRTTRDQLEYGARHLDIRPKFVRAGRRFHDQYMSEDFAVTGHYSHVDVKHLELSYHFEWFGADGQAILDIIADINAFTSRNNELIIVHLSHALDRSYKDFNQADWDRLLDLFLKVNHRYIAQDVTDLSTLTLRDFIGGESPHPTVIVLVDGPPDFQLKHDFTDHGFYPSSALPKAGSYSNTNNLTQLRQDQFSKMSIGNPIGGIFELHWYMTHDWKDAFRATVMERLRDGTHKLLPADWEDSLLEFGDRSNQALYKELWPRLLEEGAGFPNLVTVDNLRDGGVRSLVIAINDWFQP